MPGHSASEKLAPRERGKKKTFGFEVQAQLLQQKLRARQKQGSQLVTAATAHCLRPGMPPPTARCFACVLYASQPPSQRGNQGRPLGRRPHRNGMIIAAVQSKSAQVHGVSTVSKPAGKAGKSCNTPPFRRSCAWCE